MMRGGVELDDRISQTHMAKLLQQDDWPEWEQTDFKQLDQYKNQFMFGALCKPLKKSAVFNLIWTYLVTLKDGRKKAQMTCDG